MERIAILILISISCSISGFGQVSDSIDAIGLIELSRVNQGNSYITSPTDIGNIEPLWFEANLIPNFYLRESKSSRLLGVITPQVIIRMFQEESYPVRTPSYMPQITLYYMLKGKVIGRKLSLYGRFAHHSNGQEGDFYLENGEVNLKTGNFSTTYFESGLILTKTDPRFNAYQFFKTSLEIHPQIWLADELEGIYGKYRWNNAFSIYKLPYDGSPDGSKKAKISVKGESTWMFGELLGWNWASLNRLNFNVTLSYHPRFLEDIGLFVQYYHGMDYYNIYFHHRLDILRFGIMTEKLRF